MNNLPKISIVILSWNSQKYLEKFLPSVLASTYENFEVIVIDNASTDATLSFLSENYPQIKIVVHETNLGFTGGYNNVLKEINSPYYVLLNSDVEVDANWLQPMVELLENDKTIAACQPKLLSFNNKKYFEYAGAAGGWIDGFGYPFAKGRIFDVCEENRNQYNQTEEIFWASGASFFIRSAAFHEMNGFDSYFFAHQEEIDLCWRLQHAGYKIFSCPSAIVYHVGGGTLPRGNSLKTYLNFRNNLIMLFKNMPWKEKIGKIPFRILLDLLSGFKGLLKADFGYFKAIVKAHFSFYKWILFHQKKSLFPFQKKKNLVGRFSGNIVWQHFVNKKNYFNEIID